jgi:hypothetical protein
MTTDKLCTTCGHECSTESGVCRDCQVSADKKLFIEYYRQLGAVGVAAKSVKVSRRTIYNWMEADAEFRAIYEEELKPDRIDELVHVLYMAALGVKPLTMPQVMSAFFLLKALDPKTFAEKYQIGGATGLEPIKVEFILEKPKNGDKPVVYSAIANPPGGHNQYLPAKL